MGSLEWKGWIKVNCSGSLLPLVPNEIFFYKNVAFLATTLQQSIQKCRVNQVMNLTAIQWIDVMVKCWDCYSFLKICLYPEMSESNNHWYIKLCTNFYIYMYYFLNSEVEMVKQLTSVESEQKKTIADLEADILACHTKESELLAFSEKMTAKNAELQSTISGTLSKVFFSLLIFLSILLFSLLVLLLPLWFLWFCSWWQSC